MELIETDELIIFFTVGRLTAVFVKTEVLGLDFNEESYAIFEFI